MYITPLQAGSPAGARYRENEEKRRRRPPTKGSKAKGDQVEISEEARELASELVHQPVP